jgi:isochorismate pyruvate lyase
MKTPADCQTMIELREAIDQLDQELIAMLAKRYTYIDRAAELKMRVGMPPRTIDRIKQVVAQVRQHAKDCNLDPDLIEVIWRALIENSIAREAKIMGHS